MAFLRPNYLTRSELEQVLDSVADDVLVTVERIRSHNNGEIRRSAQMSAVDLRENLLRAHDEGNLTGGDWEVFIEKLGQKLIAHHDGVFWLESVNPSS
jgi:hypothetical protein